MTKIRTYVNASSLGSYFGIGFYPPEMQFKIDLGEIIPEFSEDAKLRMLIGNKLENGVLDIFENILATPITNRNTQVMEFYDGKMKGKMDGLAFYQGEKTVIECKVSNSSSGAFVDNLNYYLQVQAYMLATDAKQAILCGLQNGEPIQKLIFRDEDAIADIKEMVDFVVNCLSGLSDFNDYPKHLAIKYSKETVTEPLKDVTQDTVMDIHRLAVLKEEMSQREKQIKEIEARIKDKYTTGVYEDATFKLTLYEGTSAGRYDMNKLQLENPSINIEKYKGAGNTYKAMRLTIK